MPEPSCLVNIASTLMTAASPSAAAADATVCHDHSHRHCPYCHWNVDTAMESTGEGGLCCWLSCCWMTAAVARTCLRRRRRLIWRCLNLNFTVWNWIQDHYIDSYAENEGRWQDAKSEFASCQRPERRSDEGLGTGAEQSNRRIKLYLNLEVLRSKNVF